jgi:AbiV family abortive infection protein
VTAGEQDAGTSQDQPSAGAARGWVALVGACVENGHGLLADAELLLEHGRAARAVSLAVLAVEEYGKACQAMAVVNSGGSAEELSEYRRLSTRHGGKITAALILQSVFDENESFTDDFADKLNRLAGDSSAQKMRGFYVDRSVDGLSSPRDMPTSDAAEAVEVARVIAARWTRLLGPLDLEHHAELLWQLGPMITAEMERVAAGLDASPGDVLAALREFLTAVENGTCSVKLEDP